MRSASTGVQVPAPPAGLVEISTLPSFVPPSMQKLDVGQDTFPGLAFGISYLLHDPDPGSVDTPTSSDSPVSELPTVAHSDADGHDTLKTPGLCETVHGPFAGSVTHKVVRAPPNDAS
jgi:hypothetical protein